MDEYARGGTLEGLGGPIRMDPVSYDGIDPTLDSCCQREIKSNRYGNALTRALQRHDVVAMAERRRRNLVKTSDNRDACRCCFDPNSDGGEYLALMELRQKRLVQIENLVEEEKQTTEEEPSQHDDDDASSSDDEFDYLLDEDIGDNDNSMLKQAEDRRRAELEFAALTQQILTQHGYGIHRQMHPSRVLRAAGLGDGNKNKRQDVGFAPAVVLHLVDPESIASASLDLLLEDLAGMNTHNNSHHQNSRYAAAAKGTKFMRSGGRSTLLMDADLAARVLPRLQPDRDLPALVAIRDGIVVNTCPRLSGLTTHPTDHEVDVDAVFQWLDRSGVLLPEPPRFDEVCMIRPEEEALMDYLQTAAESAKVEEEEKEARYDCGNPDCSKTFPHEHVGMGNEQQSGLVVSEEKVVGSNN
ncbi:expressed unknown protein [Seminavis robusta]|uniref:Uncharacterized protein n=1 Tax=Seminavis robusta TaxID=568900 RepID=A0A9N8D725_9STRA|nr:expressed unknown protein [Seminavis robusta]|eukprot:Sro17_g012550.1 n/a (413) ;mRNA; f:147090-148412